MPMCVCVCCRENKMLEHLITDNHLGKLKQSPLALKREHVRKVCFAKVSIKKRDGVLFATVKARETGREKKNGNARLKLCWCCFSVISICIT